MANKKNYKLTISLPKGDVHTPTECYIIGGRPFPIKMAKLGIVEVPEINQINQYARETAAMLLRTNPNPVDIHIRVSYDGKNTKLEARLIK